MAQTIEQKRHNREGARQQRNTQRSERGKERLRRDEEDERENHQRPERHRALRAWWGRRHTRRGTTTRADLRPCPPPLRARPNDSLRRCAAQPAASRFWVSSR